MGLLPTGNKTPFAQPLLPVRLQAVSPSGYASEWTSVCSFEGQVFSCLPPLSVPWAIQVTSLLALQRFSLPLSLRLVPVFIILVG